METLKDYMTKRLPDMPVENLKLIISIYREYMESHRYNYCMICDKELSDQERQMHLTGDFFLVCCTDHIQYQNTFNLFKIRHELGIKPEYGAQINL